MTKYNTILNDLGNNMHNALTIIPNGTLSNSLQKSILDHFKTLIHVPDEFRNLDFSKEFDAAGVKHRQVGFGWRTKPAGGKAMVIQNPKMFMEASSDFWEGAGMTKDFFNLNFQSLKESGLQLWNDLLTMNPSVSKYQGLGMIDQLNPDPKTLQPIYNFQDELLNEFGTSSTGVVLHTNKRFGGLKTQLGSTKFPIEYYGKIITLNSILHRNPQAPDINSQEFIDLVNKWKDVIIIGNGKAGANLVSVKVRDVEELAEFLASVIQFPTSLRNRSLFNYMARGSLIRYMDEDTYVRIKKVRDEMINYKIARDNFNQ